ncbi:UNVERIFIED_CONTAM: hypothetical protein FKN15_042193 [Acipenser sinensis]
MSAWFQLALICKAHQDPIATNGHLFPWNKVRLPDKIVPVHYDLRIHPNLTSLNFTGTVKIEVLVKEETSFVILHSKDLEITGATIIPEEDLETDSLGKNVSVLEYPSHEQIALQAAEPLAAHRKYRLCIEFRASLAEGFDGFYKSTYRTVDGEKRILATTDFEPTAARMAFPCFDEPSFKATFSIKISRERQHLALSNMPKIMTLELEGGLLEDHFDKSVKMSTYLVAYIVCDFRAVSAVTSSGIKISVYAVPEKWNQTHYALEVAVKMLEFYEHYFNISYPLPKQDLVAIPDFQSGAMENWGLITYRETSLLYDPQTSCDADKLWITKVIGHELAHQWFGNLVTMEWWNDIWLNEGFARYMERVSVNSTYPDIQIWFGNLVTMEWWNDIWLNEGFARYMERVSVNSTYPDIQIDDYFLNVCFGAMARDSLNSSHPITNPAETPTQIMEMFDAVSYDKGACVLNMLKDFLTEDVFQNGVIRYLRRYSYKNAKSDDLWDSMANYHHAEEHMHLKEMMDTWTLQMGIPLVVVERSGKQVRIRQERFLKGVLQEDPEWAALQSGYLWHVPLTYFTSGSGSVGRHLLRTKSDTIELEGEVSWVKFNADMNGYYVVHYEGDGWDSLIHLLDRNHTALSHKDRTNLIHNAFQLVSVGRLSLDRALDLTSYLRQESENIPLLQGVGFLEVLYRMMERRGISDVAEGLKVYTFFTFYLPATGTNPPVACLPTDVLRTVYLIGAQTSEGWNQLLEYYRVSMSATEKNKILSALTQSRDTDKLTKLINLSMEGEVIRTQDLAAVIATISRNPAGQALAWNFVRNNWSKLLEKLINLSMEGEVIRTQDLAAVIATISRNPAGQALAWNFVRNNWSKLLENSAIAVNLHVPVSERASLPRNMIENSMFEEEPDVVDLAKEPSTYPLEPDDVVYEPRSSRLLVRGLGENELDEEEEDYESSARLLGMSFMNRSSSLRSNSSPYGGQVAGRACSFPSARSLLVGAFVLVVVASVAMVIYFLPKCTFTKEGCHKANQSMALIYPIASKGHLFPWTSMRLPRAVIPVHYDLTLQPNLTTMKFTGSVTITVKVNEDTKNVVLHSSGLDISKISIRPVGENQPKPAQYVEYHPWQQIAVQCPETLQKGRSYDLKLEYSANLSDSYYGFYKSSYRDKYGEQRWLAATQFEPLAARMAFPCFDEPAFKATFLIKINRDKEYISLSNMPKNKTTLVSGGFYQDVFDKSVTMSTYLVAFIVADFKNISMEANGTQVSVYAVPDKLDQVNHALETAIKLLGFYNCYFHMPYPLQKLDLVAIPDFQAGAMENWGLITFRETSLLYENTSSLLDKQLVTIVIAHELAHQWFGNLVTMEWWNDLWLNEGFATFMEYMSIERIFPDLNVWFGNLVTMEWWNDLWLNEGFATFMEYMSIERIFPDLNVWFGNVVTMEWWNDLWLNEGFATFMEYMSIERIFPDLNVGDDFLAMRFRAMGKDSLNSSHPITNQVATAEQVEEMFDSVSYEKGASILLMLKSSLTEEQFQNGVAHYLSQHKNANTQSEDLWASMSQITEKANITELMKSWTLQKGFPLVTVTRNGTKMTLQQERFLLSVDNSSSSSSSYLWQVPLTSINSSCSNASSCKSVILLKEQSATIYVPEEVQWVKFNIDMEGFYMVHYGEDGWRDLIILLKSNHSALSYQDRASLISDIFGLARLGKVSIQQVLNLTRYLVNETSTPPVTEALLQLKHIYRLLDKRGLLQLTARMKTYILELFEKLIANQSWNEEVSITQQKLRSSLLGTACSYNHKICIEKAKNIFLNWTKSPANASIPADLMRTVFTVGIRHCDGWDSVLEAYSNSSFEAEREKMLQALASSADIRKLIWLMQTSLNGEVVRTQELPLVLTTISKNFEGHLYAWGFVKENWDKIITKFNLGSFAIHNIVMGTTSEFSTQAHLFEVKNFFGSLKDKGSQLRSVREAVETIQLNIQWMDRNVEALSHSL